MDIFSKSLAYFIIATCIFLCVKTCNGQDAPPKDEVKYLHSERACTEDGFTFTKNGQDTTVHESGTWEADTCFWSVAIVPCFRVLTGLPDETIVSAPIDGTYYDFQGAEVVAPIKGIVYIYNRKLTVCQK